jgi:site-specific recombinase XerD
MARCQRICAVPLKRAAHQCMEYLEDAEMGAMLSSIDRDSRHGPRDHALLLFMYNTGARVQEVVDLKLDDLRLDTPPQAKLSGKGGKSRTCPLWSETVQALRSYLNCRTPSQESCPQAFLNANGQPFTRFGIRYIVRQYAAKASKNCPSLKGKNVGPHTLRHTTAMHLLQSGNDLSVIKDWLGHADMNTTHEYAAIDMKMKQRVLDSCQAPAVKTRGRGRPRWLKPGILKWLDDLSHGAEIM